MTYGTDIMCSIQLYSLLSYWPLNIGRPRSDAISLANELSNSRVIWLPFLAPVEYIINTVIEHSSQVRSVSFKGTRLSQKYPCLKLMHRSLIPRIKSGSYRHFTCQNPRLRPTEIPEWHTKRYNSYHQDVCAL